VGGNQIKPTQNPMKSLKSIIFATTIGAALLAGSTPRIFAQAVVPTYDLGTNADGTVVTPVPGLLDITNFNPTPNTDYQEPDGLNYYEDNGGALDPGGQTFTAPSSNVVLTAVSLEMGLDSGDADGYGGTGPGVFWLRIYSVSGTTATPVASFTSSNTFTFNAGDWLQWTNLTVPLNANGVYAYSFARDVNTPGWCQIYAANGNSYPGGQICLIEAAGGANSITYGNAGTWDGNFDLGIAPLTTPVATPPVFTPASPVYGGSPVTVSENAGGTPPLSYQWQTDNGSGGALVNINGATSSNVVVNPDNVGTYAYDVIVANNSGSITSSVSSLTVVAPSAPLLTQDITPNTNVFAFANGSVTYSAAFNGTLPINYQWLANTNGNYSNVGANTNVLTLSNIQMSAAGSYELTANNTVGSSNSSVSTLNVLVDPPAPTLSEAYPYAVFTNNPLAYWRLNETNDNIYSSLQAYDYSGNNLNATYGNGAYDDQPGPAAPSFSGFEANNTAATFINNTPGSHITLPSLNLNTNNVTITAWINPSGVVGTYWGLFMWRGNNGDAAGFGFGGESQNSVAELGYTWNTNSASTWGYNSDLYPPLGQWSFVALTITPTNTSIYLYYTGGGTTNLLKSVQSITNYPESFSGGTIEIGGDSGGGDGRDFNGSVDEVAVFSHDLSESQLQNLFLQSIGASGVFPSIASEPANLSGFAGPSYQFTVSGGGSPPPTYQWQSAPTSSGPWSNLSNGGRISGATSSALTFSHTLDSDGINYQVVLANRFGSVTSTPVTLTLTPVPTNGQWTVNFAIDNGANGTGLYVGSGILGTGSYWNALTIPGAGGFRTTAPVYQDNGQTVSSIAINSDIYNAGYGSYSANGVVVGVDLLGPYAEITSNSLTFADVPNGTYNLALFGVDGAYTNQGCVFTVNGVTQSTEGGPVDAFHAGINAVLYQNVTVLSNTLVVDLSSNIVDYVDNGQTDGAFNGAQIQLVQAAGNPSTITSVSLTGENLILSGTSLDSGATYRILSTTNLVLSLVNWTPVTTNVFSSGGFTNAIPINPANPQEFYRVVEP
jgi:hypothetical protein